MRLFYAPNTIAVTAAITLQEAGRAYDPVLVDFKQAAQTKPEYHAVNPKGRVPALDVDGEILTETGAILDYIAAITPDAKLVPDDPFEAAQMRSVMYYLASTAHINHAHKMRGTRWANTQESFDDMTAKVPQTMTATAQFLESHALTGPFVLGDQLSLADPYLFCLCDWMPADGVDMAQFPKLSAFVRRMNERPSVAAVRAKGILK